MQQKMIIFAPKSQYRTNEKTGDNLFGSRDFLGNRVG